MVSENLFSAKSLEYLEKAKEIARGEGEAKVDTDHLLIALLSEETSPLARFLEKRGVERRELLRRVREHLRNLKEQIEKAVQQEAAHLINLRSQVMEVKSQIGGVQVELDKVRRAKERLSEEIDRARRFGDLWSLEGLLLEMRRLEAV